MRAWGWGESHRLHPQHSCCALFLLDRRRARVVKGMDWKPPVISRAGSGSAVDANCGRVVVLEGVREGTQGYQLRLETAPVLLCRFLIVGVEL